MKFLLINPFLDYTKVNKIFALKNEIPPLGLLYIASALENKGHDVILIDFCSETFTEKRLLESVEKVDAVGITVRTKDINSVKKIIDVIKSNYPNTPIIIGGPHCTIDPVRATTQTNADICVKGEGEGVITKIADALDKNGNLELIPGVYYSQGNEIKNGPPAMEIKDLDSIPFPARHLVDQYDYGEVVDGYNPTRGKVTSIIGSRGCPYNCRYCINGSIYKNYRTRSAENIIDEIKEIIEKYDFLHVIDENFFADMKVANKILDFLIENNHKMKIWISGIRADSANEKLFLKMKKAGVTTINIGIESGNQDVLDFYHKQITLEQVKKAVVLARKMRFLTIGYFMLGAPIETEKHLKNTIEFAKSLPLDIASFAAFSYRKGAPIWEKAVEEGLIQKDEYMVLCDSSRGLGFFTNDEIIEWVIRAFKSFHLRPMYIFDQLIQSIIRWDFQIPKSGLKLLLRTQNVLKIK